MALVGKLWHNALAPTAGACMPALTRQITLGAQDMLSVQELAQPWWGWIRGQKSVRIITDIEIVSLAAGCPTITYLDLFNCVQITDAGLASLAAGCPAIATLDLECCNQVTDKRHGEF